MLKTSSSIVKYLIARNHSGLIHCTGMKCLKVFGILLLFNGCLLNLNVRATNLKETVEAEIVKENLRWDQIAEIVRSAIISCEPRRLGFYEVTVVDLCTKCEIDKLFRNSNDGSRFVFNAIIRKFHQFQGAVPEFVIIVLDKLNDVRK